MKAIYCFMGMRTLLHFVALFHIASLLSAGVDNEKALGLDNRIFFSKFSLISRSNIAHKCNKTSCCILSGMIMPNIPKHSAFNLIFFFQKMKSVLNIFLNDFNRVCNIHWQYLAFVRFVSTIVGINKSNQSNQTQFFLLIVAIVKLTCLICLPMIWLCQGRCDIT